MTNKNITINITTGSFFKALFVILLLIFSYLIRDVIVIVLLSVVIASGAEPATVWFQRRKIPRVLAVILTYLVTFIVLGAMFYIIIPTLFSELLSFNTRLSSSLEKPLDFGFLGSYIPESVVGSGVATVSSAVFKDLITQITSYLGNFAGGFFQLIVSVFGGAMSFILVVVLSFYLSVQEKGIENFLRIITPLDKEKYIIDLWKRAKHKIGLWLQGQILLGLIVGVFCYLGLAILGVEYALIFALLAGLFELIPIFGPILSAVPPMLISFLHSPVLAIEVGILYLIVQQLENHLIYPVVVRKIVGIPPIIVILAIVVGAKLGGFLGIILAVPFATVISEILNDIDIKKHSDMGHKTNDECLK